MTTIINSTEMDKINRNFAVSQVLSNAFDIDRRAAIISTVATTDINIIPVVKISATTEYIHEKDQYAEAQISWIDLRNETKLVLALRSWMEKTVDAIPIMLEETITHTGRQYDLYFIFSENEFDEECWDVAYNLSFNESTGSFD